MIQLLDCTLRDGGYCNRWAFGEKNIEKILTGLVDANIDIIECGILTDKVEFNPHITQCPDIEKFADKIPLKKNSLFVCLMNFGEYDPSNLPPYHRGSMDGIRVAFHKKNASKALEVCRNIKEKGYRVFVQAMVSLNYTDKEFLNLLESVNELNPFAFYIVDSFGVMKRKDLMRLFYLVEHNLNLEVKIGFHSHNNMQLSFSNAQTLADLNVKHDIIIDSSVYGMGRGAGNLNTELFVEYLNDNNGAQYRLPPLLSIIDDVLMNFYGQNPWGYSLPYYLSAKHNEHPNYAGYLDDKKTLTIEDMHKIFDMMDKDKRNTFDREYIENLYFQYMSGAGSVSPVRTEKHVLSLFKGKTILLIAPGRSSQEEKEKIVAFHRNNPVISIGVNFSYPAFDTDYIFVSNLRRFRNLDINARKKCIATSNIQEQNVYFQLDYGELLNDRKFVRDNAGLMAIKFLMKCDAKEIYLAGFDGYSHNTDENYGDSQMSWMTRNEVLDAMNIGISKVLHSFSSKIPIYFLTNQKHLSF